MFPIEGDSDEFWWNRETTATSSLQLCGFPSLTDRHEKKKVGGMVEMVLFNMASFLGSFAAGFDVRMSNLQPQPVPHPKLQVNAQLKDNKPELDPTATIQNSPRMYKEIYLHEHDIMNVGNPNMNRLYGLQTYHGPSKQKIR